MGKTNQELFDELLMKKHGEIRAELTKPASLASVDFEADMLVRAESPDGMPRCIELYADPVCPPGTIFGIDRASPQNRLKGATVESATKVLQELWPDFAENYERQVLNRKLAELWERELEATKHELRTTTPGYNFKLTLTDDNMKERTMHKARENRFNRDEPERRERVNRYDQGYDCHTYPLRRADGKAWGQISIDNEVVHDLALRHDKREAILDAFDVIHRECERVTNQALQAQEDELRRTLPKALKSFEPPKHALLIDALGFEKIEIGYGHFGNTIMVTRPIKSALDRKFALPGPNTPMPRIERVEFQLTHEQERRVVDGVEQYVVVYREKVSRPPPPMAREWTYTADEVAYALFCRDPEIVALVERVSDAGPPPRTCADFEQAKKMHQARAEKMLPFFKKAWDRGHVPDGEKRQGDQVTLEIRARARARTQAVTLLGDLARM